MYSAHRILGPFGQWLAMTAPKWPDGGCFVLSPLAAEGLNARFQRTALPSLGLVSIQKARVIFVEIPA